MSQGKNQHIQIRVSASEKQRIRRAAKAAGKGLSAWILGQLLHDKENEFYDLVKLLAKGDRQRLVLASLHDFLLQLGNRDFNRALTTRPNVRLPAHLENIVAAMVEQSAYLKRVDPPQWVTDIEPLATPWFASNLLSVRTYLLCHAPVAFRRRNIFVDSTMGDRI